VLIGRKINNESVNDNMGGSEFLEVFFEKVSGKCPDIDIEYEKRLQRLCLDLIDGRFIKSAHDVSSGGLAVTIAESCIYGKMGAEINASLLGNNFLKTFYSEPQSQILISCQPENLEKIEKYCIEAKIPFEKIGKVKGTFISINSEIKIGISEITKIFDNNIEKIMTH
jgi:phosphoribosylformylglycinamidine synthase